MTHPIVEAVAALIEDAHGKSDDGGAYDRKTAKAIVAEVLRLAWEPSEAVGRAVKLPFPEGTFALDERIAGMSWRAGIDALRREVEGE